jgi:hypothetical protein
MSAKEPERKPAKKGSSTPEDVETYLASFDHPYRQEVLALRQIILNAAPGISEGIKWNVPSFRTHEYFATFYLRDKDGVKIILHLGAKLRDNTQKMEIVDPESLLEWLSKDRASVKFRDVNDIQAKETAFVNLIREWITYV